MTLLTASKPRPTNRSNSCPICGDVSGKCRTFDDKPLALCMVESYAPSGWKDLGSTKDGLWKQFVPDTGATFDRDEYQRRKRHEKPVAVPQTMSLDERDRFYRDWLAKGSLNERDRADLQRRGITDTSIALSCDFGYAIPFKGLDGKYVGAQWRYADPGDGGRYRWHNLPGGKQFPGTDEMPIAVYKVDQPTMLALVEGTGIKPMLAAERLNAIAIGAAGGNHLASPIQLRAIVEAFPNLPIVVVPDAGDVINPKVMARHKRTAQQFPQVKFLWWGQVTKQANDIDEVSAAEIESARLLTWAEFETLSPNQKAGQGFNPQTASSKEQSPEEQARQYRDRFIQKRMARFREFWDGGLRSDFQLTDAVRDPAIRLTQYDGWAPTPDLQDDTTFVQGWLGAGKTTTIVKSLKLLLKSFIEWRDRPIVWVSPRNGLMRQIAEIAAAMRFPVFHYQDDVPLHKQFLEDGQPGIYFMAPESFKPYAVGRVNWGETILVMDEFSSIRKEMHNKSRELPQLITAIQKANKFIAADAFLSQKDVRVVRTLRSGSVHIVQQNFKKSPVKIKWVETRTKEGLTSMSHDEIYLPLIIDWISRGFRKVAIATDTLLSAKVIQAELIARGVNVWLACSETPEENHEFMPRPTELIESRGIEVVIYTPTAESGLDIQSQFDAGLLICNGVLSATKMLQMLGRCRQCREWYVSAPRRSINPECGTVSLDGKQIKAWGKKITETFTESGYNAPASLQSWGVWERLTSNIEKAFNSEYIECLLEEYFEDVKTVFLEFEKQPDSKKQPIPTWKTASKAIKRQDAERTLKADLEHGQELVEKEKIPGKNHEVWDEKLAKLHQKYPGVMECAIVSYRQDDQEVINEQVDQEAREAAIGLTQVFSTSRVEKLKNYVLSNEGTPDDDEALLEILQTRYTTYNSPVFKARQYISLHRHLKLEGRLGKIKQPLVPGKNKPYRERDEPIEHQNYFNVNSPIVEEIWQQFQSDRRLKELFPLVETKAELWSEIRACMRFLGYEGDSKSIRVETDELHPNGNDRHGNQRWSPSQSQYFQGWIVMSDSGSNLFYENFGLIMDSVRDRVMNEREERKKRKLEREASESLPPDYWIAA